MYPYRIVALDQNIADSVRKTLVSPRYGHPAQVAVATGYGPCRLCLQHFKPGQERRILFTYDAFEGQESLPLPGPIFIHETECQRYEERGPFPEHLAKNPLTFNAYGKGRKLLAQEYLEHGEGEAFLQQLLARPEIEYIHIRDTQVGCYDFRIQSTKNT